MRVKNGINFNDIILSDEYESQKQLLKDEISKDINTRKDMLLVIIDGNEYEMSSGNYLSLLILAEPFHSNNIPFTEEFLIDVSDINEYEKYFDKIIEYFLFKNEININNSLVKILDELTLLSGTINYNYGSTISLKSIIDLSKRNERFKELINMKIEPEDNLQPDEIMDLTNKNLKEMIKIILEDKEGNILQNYLKSDAGINSKQLGQVLSYIALKPDFDENIIPTPINTSFARGLQNVEEYYINSIGARKALIQSHKQVRSSGYLTRKLSLLTIDQFLNDVDDCGSKHPLELFIENNTCLKQLNGRFYYNDNNELKIIDSEKDEHLIGTTIKIRSPITCACKDGICKTCYGMLSKINKDMNIGIIATLLLTNPLTQRLLSAKHLLQANINKIEWDPIFFDYFSIIKRELSLLDDYKIIIYKDDMEFDEESDDDRPFTNKFFIDGKEFNPPVPLSINEEIDIEKAFDLDNELYEISNKDLDETDYIFKFIVENNGLSASLLDIKNLIEKDAYIKSHTINETYQYFVKLILVSGIKIDLVHIELILREMLYLYNQDRSEFLNEDFPEYTIYNISNAVQFGSRSVGKTLVFEQVYKQLMTDSYDTMSKNSSSIIDKLV